MNVDQACESRKRYLYIAAFDTHTVQPFIAGPVEIFDRKMEKTQIPGGELFWYNVHREGGWIKLMDDPEVPEDFKERMRDYRESQSGASMYDSKLSHVVRTSKPVAGKQLRRTYNAINKALDKAFLRQYMVAWELYEIPKKRK